MTHRHHRPLLLALALAFITNASAENWPQFRGPNQDGSSTEKNLPEKFSKTENVKWAAELPGLSASVPAVWGDSVFLTAPIEAEQKFVGMCIDAKTGKERWRKVLASGTRWDKASNLASPSPVTDGTIVVAWHGSAGVYAYDLKGKELWHRDLGKADHNWGYASSPVIHGNSVFVQFGPGSRNFLVALDRKTGNTVWQADETVAEPAERTDGFAGQKGKYMGSFSAPIIVKAGGREELIVSFPNRLRALDPKTGKDLWWCLGLNPLIYASPIHAEGIVVAMGGFSGTSIAVKPGGSGDVTARRLQDFSFI